MTANLVLDLILAGKVSALAVESVRSTLPSTHVFDVTAYLRYPLRQPPPIYTRSDDGRVQTFSFGVDPSEYIVRDSYNEDSLLHLCHLAMQHRVALVWAVQSPIVLLVSHLPWTYPGDKVEL